jgi:hypothetical protein
MLLRGGDEEALCEARSENAGQGSGSRSRYFEQQKIGIESAQAGVPNVGTTL